MPQPQSGAFPRHQRTREKQMPHMKPPMHKQRRTGTGEPPWNDIKRQLGIKRRTAMVRAVQTCIQHICRSEGAY